MDACLLHLYHVKMQQKRYNCHCDSSLYVQSDIHGYHKCLYGTALREYDGTCLNQTLNKTKSCINQTLICLVFEISVEIDCTNQTLVYSENKG